jgi:hypothetical protein
MSAQADMFAKPAPRAGAGARQSGLRHTAWALFEDGMALSSDAISAITGARVDLVRRRVDDLHRDGLIEPTSLRDHCHTERGSTIWRRRETMTFDLERIPDRKLSIADKTALAALDVYIGEMKKLGKEPLPRLRIEQYDRFFAVGKTYNASLTGITYKGFRVLGGGMTS